MCLSMSVVMDVVGTDATPVTQRDTDPMTPTNGHPQLHLAHDRRGAGPPLVLLHGFGMHRHAWDHLADDLARDREVITVDWPGAGESPDIPADISPTAPALAELIARFLEDDLGLERPDVVGVSAGGWIALELGRLGAAGSVTAICPGGLWRGNMPRFVRFSLVFIRGFTRVAKPALGLIFATAAGRMLMIQMVGRPWRMTRAQAVDVARTFATYPSWTRVLHATGVTRFEHGDEITAPVTVAQSSRDLLMLRGQAQHREALPDSTRFVDLPGCGHVPLWDDPELIVAVIRAGSLKT
jgi:pimeloyl-ACP methyl ester carboxylesterase